MRLIPTIICGGTGSRLWPASRAGSPKPFMKIGEGGSLIEQTFTRAAALPNVTEILTVTGRDLFQRTRDEFQLVNDRGLNTPFILEPFGRNTAAAVAVATLHCLQIYGENSLMLVLPADHLIENQRSFAEAVKTASTAAQEGMLVTFGIDPSSAHSGYGYIDVDKNNANVRLNPGWYGVRRFVEKPSKERAEEFLQSGRYLWNSGMFCSKPGVLLQEMRQHCPAIVEAALSCLSKSMMLTRAGSHCVDLDSQSFLLVPNDSIDFAVMEKTKNIVVVHGQFGWSDIGSWSAIADLAQKDGEGNSGGSNSIFHQSANCYVHGNGRAVAVVGLEDIVVVDAHDALLVAHKDRTQDVRHIFARSEGMPPKPSSLEKTDLGAWGYSKIVDATEAFRVKRLEIEIGHRLSRQDSGWPVGPWIVAAGHARIIGQSGTTTDKTGGEAYHCGPFDREIINTGDCVLTLFEVERNQFSSESLISANDTAS